MTHCKPFIAACVVLSILLGFSLGLAQPYRDQMPQPSSEINRKLMTYAQSSDFEGFEQTLPSIKPLLDAFLAKFGAKVEFNMRPAINSRDKARLIKATQQLIYLDLKDLMNLTLESMGLSTDKATVQMKSAYLNYLILSPIIEKTYFPSDQKVKNNFRTAVLSLENYAASSKGKVATPEHTGSLDQNKKFIGQLMIEIDLELIQTLLTTQ